MNIGALIGPAIGAGLQYYQGQKMAGGIQDAAAAAAAAQKDAAAGYARRVNSGVKDLGKWYGQAQGYLDPYVQAGQGYNEVLANIIGINGPGGQSTALGMYEGSPIASLIAKARDEVVRGTRGEAAAAGMSRSGNLLKDLTDRTADLDLRGYDNWQGLLANQNQMGYGAAGGSADLAWQHGGRRLDATTNIAAALANGDVGAANTMLAGKMGAMGAKSYGMGGITGFLGSPQFGSMIGGFGQGGGGSGFGGGTFSGMSNAASTAGLPWGPRSYSNISHMFGGI